jgi:hypothetical protein
MYPKYNNIMKKLNNLKMHSEPQIRKNPQISRYTIINYWKSKTKKNLKKKPKKNNIIGQWFPVKNYDAP